jgi:hypothetical protein
MLTSPGTDKCCKIDKHLSSSLQNSLILASSKFQSIWTLREHKCRFVVIARLISVIGFAGFSYFRQSVRKSIDVGIKLKAMRFALGTSPVPTQVDTQSAVQYCSHLRGRDRDVSLGGIFSQRVADSQHD